MSAEAPAAGETPSAPSLLRSGAFSVFTGAAPIVVALVALPILTRRLGTERLGLLALAWAWLAYATFLDLGLGRALTRMVAAADAGEVPDVPIGAFIATARVTLTLLGALVGAIGAVLSPWYIARVLHVSPAMRADATISAIIFAVAVPMITGSSVPRAVLEARHRFATVNLVRLPVSIGTFAVPLLLLPFTASLSVIALTLTVLRAWAWWRYATLARATMPPTPADRAAREHLRPLLRAGAWMTVSSVLSPLMTMADRFLIGSLVSVSAVAFYAVPWEAVTKLWIVPGALMMVLFPAVATASTASPARLVPLHAASVRLLTLVCIPACAITALLAPVLLQFAGGRQYSGDSVEVLRILAVGIAANCIAAAPFTLLQGTDRARWTASLHLLEIVPYVLLLWVGVHRWGIIGAAMAWSLRAIADAALMAWRAQSVAPLPAASLTMNALGVIAVALCAVLGRSANLTSPAVTLTALLLTGIVPLGVWTQRSQAERGLLGRVGGKP